MTFISYAKNLEDVMLWRVFKDIDKGFYIDVSAQDPVIDSVTKVFYDRGWRGINVDLLAHNYENFCTQRPADINLEIAVDDNSDKTEILPYRELSKFCEAYVKNKSIHFLKIEIKDSVQKILLGMPIENTRPWIIVIKAVPTGSFEKNDNAWESILLTQGYSLIYFDGLNRFYLAKEHSELAPNFCAPPNVFDEYVPHHEVLLKNVNHALRQHHAILQEKVAVLQGKAILLQNILQSKSWKMTRPFRGMGKIFKKALSLFKKIMNKKGRRLKSNPAKLSFSALLKKEVLKRKRGCV